MNKTAIFLIIMLMLGSFSAEAQRKKTVIVTGEAISGEHLTPAQTRAKAIEDAKRNALNKAGVSESITFTDFSYKFEDSEKFGEIFQAISAIQTGANIVVDTILNEHKYFNEFENLVYEVKIEATVFRHRKKADPTFQFRVDSIDGVYKAGDFLQFTVTPTQDAYLKIFNITEDETSLLYPYKDPENPKFNDKSDRLFKKNEVALLPENPLFENQGYKMHLAPEQTQEANILMFVFTKQNIPFIEDATFKNVMKWIYSISPDERVMAQEGFVIKK